MKKLMAIALAVLGLASVQAHAATGVKVGVLTCNVAGGIGYIIGSNKAVDCVYEPASGARREHYEGHIGKLGIDIGVTNQAVIGWAVFAPGKIKAGALAGSYGGASAEATVIAGLGANVLIGGFNKAINLQPISIQAQTGLNLAAGIAGLTLKFVK